ncbi:MAG: hypothetical protein II222_01060 [Paraprevotella sp.]|nr:hypothetical protein [Paraprevotella sp.]
MERIKMEKENTTIPFGTRHGHPKGELGDFERRKKFVFGLAMAEREKGGLIKFIHIIS